MDLPRGEEGGLPEGPRGHCYPAHVCWNIGKRQFFTAVFSLGERKDLNYFYFKFKKICPFLMKSSLKVNN